MTSNVQLVWLDRERLYDNKFNYPLTTTRVPNWNQPQIYINIDETTTLTIFTSSSASFLQSIASPTTPAGHLFLRFRRMRFCITNHYQRSLAAWKVTIYLINCCHYEIRVLFCTAKCLYSSASVFRTPLLSNRSLNLKYYTLYFKKCELVLMLFGCVVSYGLLNLCWSPTLSYTKFFVTFSRNKVVQSFRGITKTFI